MDHLRPDFLPWEKNVTCRHCAKSLDDNQRMRDALITNTTAGWAKHNLRILADMAADRGLPTWYLNEVVRIRDGILLIPPY